MAPSRTTAIEALGAPVAASTARAALSIVARVVAVTDDCAAALATGMSSVANRSRATRRDERVFAIGPSGQGLEKETLVGTRGQDRDSGRRPGRLETARHGAVTWSTFPKAAIASLLRNVIHQLPSNVATTSPDCGGSRSHARIVHSAVARSGAVRAAADALARALGDWHAPGRPALTTHGRSPARRLGRLHTTLYPSR